MEMRKPIPIVFHLTLRNPPKGAADGWNNPMAGKPRKNLKAAEET